MQRAALLILLAIASLCCTVVYSSFTSIHGSQLLSKGTVKNRIVSWRSSKKASTTEKPSTGHFFGKKTTSHPGHVSGGSSTTQRSRGRKTPWLDSLGHQGFDSITSSKITKSVPLPGLQYNRMFESRSKVGRDRFITGETVTPALHTRSFHHNEQFINVLGHKYATKIHNAHTNTRNHLSHVTTRHNVDTNTQNNVTTGHNVHTNTQRHVTTGHNVYTNTQRHVTTGHNIHTNTQSNVTTGHKNGSSTKTSTAYIHKTTQQGYKTTTKNLLTHGQKQSTSAGQRATVSRATTSPVTQISNKSVNVCFEFVCDDGSKVSGFNKVCDGLQHCKDGSDETTYGQDECLDTVVVCGSVTCRRWNNSFVDNMNCTFLNANISGIPDDDCGGNGTFLCDDIRCIPGSKQCDGVMDCYDGTDELGCYDCFRCSDGSCISRSDVCDGVNDCTDVSDESPDICSNRIPSPVDCDLVDKQPCYNNMQCYGDNEKCDGVKNCIDGTDELYCPCLGFACANLNCISTNLICDGNNDCGDLSDEALCQVNNTEIVCDNSKMFLCDDKSQCRPITDVCNGLINCPDGSDESDDLCGVSSSSRDCKGQFESGRFLCNDRYCIEKNEVCNGVADCKDASDEHHSLCEQPQHTRNCGPSQFVCDNYNCVSRNDVCNGINNCGDDSDEIKCSFIYPLSGNRVSDILAYGLIATASLVIVIIVILVVYNCRRKQFASKRKAIPNSLISLTEPPPYHSFK